MGHGFKIEGICYCECGRSDAEFMGIYTEDEKGKTFRCCLCESGVKEDSIEALDLYGSGRGRNQKTVILDDAELKAKLSQEYDQEVGRTGDNGRTN